VLLAKGRHGQVVLVAAGAQRFGQVALRLRDLGLEFDDAGPVRLRLGVRAL